MADIIQIRRDTASNWTSANPTLAQGEMGYETDTDKVKIGDGSTAWTSLGYVINTGSYLTSSDIGSTVQGYSAVLAGTTASFTTADETKLDGIETSATADQTKADIDALGIDAATLDGVDSTSFLRSDATDTKTSGNLIFSDGVKAAFGSAGDLEIYHDGSNSYIQDAGTGSLRIVSDGTAISLQSLTENYLQAVKDGAVTLYYDNAAKLATTSTGIDVTGTVTADGVSLGDGEKAQFGTSNDLQIYHDGTHSYVSDAGTGNLRLKGSNFVQILDASGNDMIQAESGGNVQLYHNASAKLATTSTGVSVTGKAVGTLTTDNDLSFDMNASNQFKCTPTANGTLTFTNITSGQSGNIFLVNSGGYAISAAATTYIGAADLSAISTAGSYFLSYFSDGTNVMVSASAAVTSAGA